MKSENVAPVAKKINTKRKKKDAAKKSTRSARSSRSSHSKKSKPDREKKSRANSAMSMNELQFMAKSKGIPFGGLSKTKLIKKINNFY